MHVQKEVRIISLNIQHGWNTRHMAPPFTISQKKVISNLEKIVSLIDSYSADIVLLQEVDLTSPLTRKIDQLSYIQSRTGHPFSAYGASSELRRRDRLMYSAGCGIISRYPLSDVENVKFELSFPTPRKGFLSATVTVAPETTLTVASVHLVSFDILKRESRKLQIEQLSMTLKDKKSVVIGGDLNGSIRSPHVRDLMSKLDVTTHSPTVHDRELHTFPSIRPTRRIDWIMASPHLRFSDYRTFSDRVSDHLAVGSTVHF